MSQIIVTEGAAKGMERCRSFLAEKNPNAAKKAAQAISYHFSILEAEPEIGRSIDKGPDLRELIIPFGNSGYIALYLLDQKSGSVYVLAFRHQKKQDIRNNAGSAVEPGFKSSTQQTPKSPVSVECYHPA